MCQEQFNKLGPNADGKIPVERIGEGLANLSLPLTAKEKEELANSAKDGGITEVDFSVFLDVVTQKAREHQNALEEEERQKKEREQKAQERAAARKRQGSRDDRSPSERNRAKPQARESAADR